MGQALSIEKKNIIFAQVKTHQKRIMQRQLVPRVLPLRPLWGGADPENESPVFSMGVLGSLFFPSGVAYNDKKDRKNEVDPTAVCGCRFANFFFFQIMGVLIQLSYNKNFLAYINATVKFDQPRQQQKCQ